MLEVCRFPMPNYVKISVDVIVTGGKCFISMVTKSRKSVVLYLVSHEDTIMNVQAVEAKTVLLALDLTCSR